MRFDESTDESRLGRPANSIYLYKLHGPNGSWKTTDICCISVAQC